jgi:hypothetical protein
LREFVHARFGVPYSDSGLWLMLTRDLGIVWTGQFRPAG